MKRVIVFVLIMFSVPSVFANVKLPAFFGENMVLQRDKPIVIWGWADAKEKITVSLHGKSKTITAGKNGEWKASLDAESAGGPYVLTVKGKNSISFNNILIGDVWICSGQSNMQWSVRDSNDPDKEIQNANYPTIRQIIIPNVVASEPKKDINPSPWTICSPENAANFTAVGYFFARELTKELNVPIGLINTSWGGTHVETWTSREAFAADDEFKSMIASMPRLNLDSLGKQKEKAMTERLNTMQGALPLADELTKWKRSDYDDASWKTMTLPDQWEHQTLGDFDGVVWFRKEINVSAGDAAKEAKLQLAMIDDSDVTYVNGIEVGSTWGHWNELRNYNIPAGVLKAGKNVIAVRVEDTGGGGGIYGDASQMKITMAGTSASLAGEWKWRVESVMKGTASVGPNSYPTLLFNAMINPIIPIGIKGAIWYQGEANAGRSYQYRKAFPLMINDWRKRFGQGDFPFYFVQLATYNADNGTSEKGSGWAELREAQDKTLLLPHTGMAVTTDIGDPLDIHPRNKQDVGKRLAALALNRTYGKNRVDSGPTFKTVAIKSNRMVVTFDNIGGGLWVKDKYGYVKGFEIAGADKKFKYAKAMVEGNELVIYSDDVREPVALRYNWADDASDGNLFNKEGFPVPPFRTDEWKGITEESKFIFGN